MNPPPANDAARAMTEGARPVVSPRATDVEGIERVYVWDLIVRGTHWTVVITVVILSLTGIYIGRPFLISTTGDPLVVMGTVKTVHYYTAIAFAIAVVVRLYWLFAGPYYARWHQLIPLTRERRKNMIDMIKFYSFVGGEHPPLNVGHNGLAGIFYIAVFTSYIVMILTGLALYSVSAKGAWGQSFDWLLALFGGAQSARLIHHVGMWFILGFFGHHIWSAILVTRMEGIGLMDSIFSGYKFLPKSWKNRDS